MVIDDKQEAMQKEAQRLGWTVDFFSNPDTMGLSLDKSALNVLLAVWLYDENGDLTTRAVATRVYDAGITKGLWLLGNDAVATLNAVVPGVDIWKDRAARNTVFAKRTEIADFLFSKYKTKVQKSRYNLLKEVLAEDTFKSLLFVLSYYNNIFPEDEPAQRSIANHVDKTAEIIEMMGTNLKVTNTNLPVLAKTKYLSLFNDLYDLRLPYDNTIKNILERLQVGYGSINSNSFSNKKIRTKGKIYWMKEPSFYAVWNKRRNELINLFDEKLKNINHSKLTNGDLLSAYDALVANLYSSEKIAEYYQLPIAIAQKYPTFKYAFDIKKYYSEVFFDYMLRSSTFGFKAFL